MKDLYIVEKTIKVKLDVNQYKLVDKVTINYIKTGDLHKAILSVDEYFKEFVYDILYEELDIKCWLSISGDWGLPPTDGVEINEQEVREALSDDRNPSIPVAYTSKIKYIDDNPTYLGSIFGRDDDHGYRYRIAELDSHQEKITLFNQFTEDELGGLYIPEENQSIQDYLEEIYENYFK